MRRGYKSSDFLDIVRKVRMRFGDESTIATDIIVGFPTEDDEDFERTIRLLEETKPEVINISKYGRRPGTDAAKLKDLPADIVTRRSKILTEISYEVKMERNLIHVGKDYPVLITERIGSNLFQGRTEFYRPVIVPSKKFMEDAVVGRPILSYPSRPGGFRLRYGHARDTKADIASSGRHVGSRIIRNAINELKPKACLCGHIHESPAIFRLNDTVVVNPGPAFMGRAAIIDTENWEADFTRI